MTQNKYGVFQGDWDGWPELAKSVYIKVYEGMLFGRHASEDGRIIKKPYSELTAGHAARGAAVSICESLKELA